MVEYHQSRAWFMDAASNWQARAAKMHGNAVFWLEAMATPRAKMPGNKYRQYACDAQHAAAHAAEMAMGYIALALEAKA